MQIKNSRTQYGMVSKFFHWNNALLVLMQLYLGYWTVWVLPQNSPKASFYIDGLHKPIGMIVFVITLVAIIWKLLNFHPDFPSTMERWEKFAARFVHWLLYVSLLLMPCTGVMMTVTYGAPLDFFDLYQFPIHMEKNVKLAQLFFEIHKYASYLFSALIILHIIAALKHHFVERDVILKRMLPW